MTEIRDLARDALARQADVADHLTEQPPRRTVEDEASYLAWARQRDQLVIVRETAARQLLAHPDYPAWHRRCWRDDVTTTMPAVFVWAPVARLIVAGGQAAPRIA